MGVTSLKKKNLSGGDIPQKKQSVQVQHLLKERICLEAASLDRRICSGVASLERKNLPHRNVNQQIHLYRASYPLTDTKKVIYRPYSKDIYKALSHHIL